MDGITDSMDMSLSKLWELSSAYLRLLIFFLSILIPVCASSNPAFHMMHLACKLNNQCDNIQSCHCPFPMETAQFSYSVISNSLQTHGLQQARFPCPSPTPRAGGSYGSSISSFLRNLHIVLHNGYTSLHFHQQWKRVTFLHIFSSIYCL